MGTRQEINQLYQKYYQKDFPSSTLSKWVKEKRIKATLLSDGRTYDYDLKNFEELISAEDYNKKIKATKENPKNYIGKQVGYLLIQGIVPEEQKKESYKGTLMYCKCLKCNRPDLIQVRFSYLTPNGNYHQLTCGCGRKERAFLAVTRKDIREEFINKYSNNFETFLFIHKLLMTSTDKYYQTCPIEEYENAVEQIYNDNQFNAVYKFWQKHKNENNTFYDWAKPSIDHIVPKSKGGDNKISNLQILTVFENLSKRDLTQVEWIEFKKNTNTQSNYFIESILRGEG